MQAARCLSYHQATSGQHAIQALATAPLRRLALSMLFTIVTTSSQTTVYSLQEIFNKRQHANARHRVAFLHYDMVAAQTQPQRRNRMDVSQCQLLEETASEGKAAKAARLLFGPPAAPACGKGLGPDQCRGALGSCGKIVLINYEGRQPGQLHPRDHQSKYSRAKWHYLTTTWRQGMLLWKREGIAIKGQ